MSFYSKYEQNLFLTRYRNPTYTSQPEEVSWDDVFRRVVRTVAYSNTNPQTTGNITPVERKKKYQAFIEGMSSGQFMPSSPQLWNYGSNRVNGRNGSSCFTGDLGDNLRSFAESLDTAEKVYISSGGYGVVGNSVRPRRCKISYAQSGSVGVMGSGGPFEALEKKTGYITNGGRERGALMLQLSAWHPDCLEFVLAKKPVRLGFLDDWERQVCAFSRHENANGVPVLAVLTLFQRFAYKSKWPTYRELMEEAERLHLPLKTVEDEIFIIKQTGNLVEDNGVLVPHVQDGDIIRPANMNWRLPLQNCNMSVRVPDSLIYASRKGAPWVFSWDSTIQSGPATSQKDGYAKDGQMPWVLTDTNGKGKNEIWEDGRYIHVQYGTPDDRGHIYYEQRRMLLGNAPRYQIVLTTWQGLLENLQPNPNNFKDVEYAMHFEEVLKPVILRLKEQSPIIMAEQVLGLIYECAHGWADPGIVFEDTYARFDPLKPGYGVRLSNPCSEYVNPPHGSCNLVSHNLRTAAMVQEEEASRDHDEPPTSWEALRSRRSYSLFIEQVIHQSQLAFNYIAMAQEYNIAPSPIIQEMSSKHFRTVGVGMMGLAEALMTFKIRYGSRIAQQLAAEAAAWTYVTCWEFSFKLGLQGWPKPIGWSPERMVSIFQERIEYAKEYDLDAQIIDKLTALIEKVKIGEYATHTATTSVAPNGSIAMIAAWAMSRYVGSKVPLSVGSGIEPTFSRTIARQDNSGTTVTHHDLITEGNEHADWVVTASELSAEEHCRMQAAVSAFTCMSVSKTINLPNSASVQDVKSAYELAWELGIPGTSVYRDHSKPMQVLTALECPSGECGIKPSNS